MTDNDLALAQAAMVLVQMAEKSGDDRIRELADKALQITKETAFDALLRLALMNMQQPQQDDFDARQASREEHAKQMRETLLQRTKAKITPQAILQTMIESIQNGRANQAAAATTPVSNGQ